MAVKGSSEPGLTQCACLLQVLPELQAQNVNDLPVLKADALKFLTTFRSQLPKDACVRIFERLVALLGSESNVVHTYAATAVERLLSSKVTASCTAAKSSESCLILHCKARQPAG